MSVLKWLKCPSLLALPLPLLAIWGCGKIGFDPLPNFDPGEDRTTAIFCDIERDRNCATFDDIEAAIKDPVQDGFMVGRSGLYGLDSSPEAMQACGGMPRKIVFQGQFPNGSPVCLNPNRFGPGPDQFPDATAACRAWCYSHNWIDKDGNFYNCDNIARPSFGAVDAAFDPGFQNACTPAGTLRADFDDPRIP